MRPVWIAVNKPLSPGVSGSPLAQRLDGTASLNERLWPAGRPELTDPLIKAVSQPVVTWVVSDDRRAGHQRPDYSAEVRWELPMGWFAVFMSGEAMVF